MECVADKTVCRTVLLRSATLTESTLVAHQLGNVPKNYNTSTVVLMTACFMGVNFEQAFILIQLSQ